MVKRSRYISAGDGDCETVRMWSSLGSNGWYIFSHLAGVFTLVVKLSIMKFWHFKINLTLGDELWCRQAQNGVKFDFYVKFDGEGQGQPPPPPLNGLQVIVQTSLGLTHRRTEQTEMQATTIPRGPNLALGKNLHIIDHKCCNKYDEECCLWISQNLPYTV